MKDYWDIDNGASYIPWSELPADLNKLTDGGFIDEDTLPEHLKSKCRQLVDKQLIM